MFKNLNDSQKQGLLIALTFVFIGILGFASLNAYNQGFEDGQDAVLHAHRSLMVFAHTDMVASQANAPYLMEEGEKVQFRVMEDRTQTQTWAVAITYRSTEFFEINGESATEDEHGMYSLTTFLDKESPIRRDEVTKATSRVSFSYTSGGGERVTMQIWFNPINIDLQ